MSIIWSLSHKYNIYKYIICKIAILKTFISNTLKFLTNDLREKNTIPFENVQVDFNVTR